MTPFRGRTCRVEVLVEEIGYIGVFDVFFAAFFVSFFSFRILFRMTDRVGRIHYHEDVFDGEEVIWDLSEIGEGVDLLRWQEAMGIGFRDYGWCCRCV